MLHPEIIFINGPVRLTPVQRRVVDFVLANADQAAFMTAAKLGQKLGVSDATVVRLSQVLGFEGFSHLRRHLRQHLMSRFDTVSRMERGVDKISSVGDVLSAVMKSDLENLEQTAEKTSKKTFEDVAGVLSKAARISIVGLRSAYSLAQFMASAMRVMGKDVTLLTPGIGYLWSDVRNLGDDSVLVAFSFPRYTKVTVEVAREAQSAGATVVSITDSALSPLANHSDYILPASFSLESFMESYVAALSLINALVTAVAYIMGNYSMSRLNELEGIWREKEVYFKE